LFPILQIKNLTVEFPATESAIPALQDFSMELNRGEMVAIVGESGSGKSVMSLALMKLLHKTAHVKGDAILFSSDGENRVELLDMKEKEFRPYRGSQMAMIFQEPMTSLNPVMTCGAQICEPLILHKNLNHRNAKAAALILLQKVQIDDPERVYKKYPHQLSGGQRQRVMIAMAISCNPSILICDEPTTALDVIVQKTILELLKKLCLSDNMSMIFITHDLGLVTEMADRVLVMLRGRVVESGIVKELFKNPKSPYTRGLLMCRPSLYSRGNRLPVISDFLELDNSGDTESKSILPVYLNLIPKTGESFPEANLKKNIAEASREILIRVKGLHVRYSTGRNFLGIRRFWVDAIRDINFDVFKGETLGVVGESGSGKTTLGRALLGLNNPLQGSVFYEGRDLLIIDKSALRSFRSNIQIVFQDPYSSLNPRLMIGPAISEPIKTHESCDPAERRERVLELLKKVDLKPEFYNRYPHEFSGGQRQRIVIARALSLNPGFVVFDESVSALDVSVQAQILNLINDLKEKLGFTAVFISHDLSVIRYLCDRVIVMEKGKIVECDNVEEVYQNPKTEYTRSLIAAIPGSNRKF
jgi:peptide/nickel transport system ATP-binding protein